MLRGRWESSRGIPGSCPAHFLDQRGPIWNHIKPNVFGERTLSHLSQSILPMAPCHCHTPNTIEHIPKYSPISCPPGRSSQLFSSTLVFSCSPGKSAGKQKPCTAFWWGEITWVPGRFQQNAAAVFDIGKALAESILHWLLTLVLAEPGFILKQLSMNLLGSTSLQLPKHIFTQCSQICYAEKDLSFNYPTQSTTFIGILPKFI